MVSESKPTYDWINVPANKGSISVQPVKNIPPNSESYNILVMGMTSVGKSKFIESFSSKPLKNPISGSSLESTTRDLTVYKLVNVELHGGYPIFLIDTPGFADPNLSEMTVVKQIQGWMRTNKIEVIHHILFLDRISDTRVAGIKGKVFDMFKELTGSGSAENITILTTMWDLMQYTEKQKIQAEARFQQLKNEHWKEFIDKGARILKFEHTQSSALEAVDQCLLHGIRKHFDFVQAISNDQDIRDTNVAENMRQMLGERVASVYLEYRETIKGLEECNRDPTPNENLRGLLLEKKPQLEGNLIQFVQELEECGYPKDDIAKQWPDLPEKSLDLEALRKRKGFFEKLKSFLQRAF
ncbi:hypothetical protein BJ165DRAFT_899794 [Panaeolus papilionaceus]|nr:hypothetical protein BJ165DRAFT_899794 [Panaeolus papilionaceus]